MRTRLHKKNNYFAIADGCKTVRFCIEDDKDITELDYPEFYDIKITNKCNGKCPYCYQDSLPNGAHAENVIENLRSFFGSMNMNQRPFQVAIGGGEPTLHPQFIEVLETLDDLGIIPNYTTNGMNLTPEIIEASKKYCGGVAVSAHGHLQWQQSVDKLLANGVTTCIHSIISDESSINYFVNSVYNNYYDKVKYIVLLPYEMQGRAGPCLMRVRLLATCISRLADTKKLAFGAGFYTFLKRNPQIKADLYVPEIMSKFLDMTTMKMYRSSFAMNDEVPLPITE